MDFDCWACQKAYDAGQGRCIGHLPEKTVDNHALHVRLGHTVANCEECTGGDRRTYKEWNESGEFPFKVLDPDGFPRHDISAMQNKRWTREAFYERAMGSTIQPLSRG